MSDSRVFRPARLLESTDGDRKLAAQVIAIFLDDTPKQLRDLEAAVAAGGAAECERIAHSIKGSAATLGGEQFRAAAFVCETLGREGRLDDLRETLPLLRVAYGELETALRAEYDAP